MRSDEAYKAEVFARRDAVLRVRRRRRRVVLSLLPILCVAGISVAFFLRLPQNAPTKETADGTETTEATRLAGQNGAADDAMNGYDGADAYKQDAPTTMLSLTAQLSPRTVYWADDAATLAAYFAKTEDPAFFSAQAAAYDAAFFETYRLLIVYLTDSTADTLVVEVEGDRMTVSPQLRQHGTGGNRLLLQAVPRTVFADVKTVCLQ